MIFEERFDCTHAACFLWCLHSPSSLVENMVVVTTVQHEELKAAGRTKPNLGKILSEETKLVEDLYNSYLIRYALHRELMRPKAR